MIEIDTNSDDNRRRTLGSVMRFARFKDYQQQYYTISPEQIKPEVDKIVAAYRLAQLEHAAQLINVAKRYLAASLPHSAPNNLQALQASIEAHTFIVQAIITWRQGGKESKVGLYREPQRMSLEELLVLLVEEPDRMEWLATAVTTRVRGAMAITPRWVRLTEKGGAIDIDKTVSRVTRLAQGSREWAEHPRPALRVPVATLDEALGLK